MPYDDVAKNFMYDCCEKISRAEANQAFRSGMRERGMTGPTVQSSGRPVGRKKRGYTSCVRKNGKTNDENWAQRQPKLTESLEVRKQQSAVGRGLFVRKPFKSGFEKGDAIGEYVGERILEDDYQSRIEQYQQDKEFNYIVGVDTDEVSGLYIDATKKGNWTRFVNNSHDPNAQFEPVIIGGTWRIFMVAIKRIKPGEEVTIDYGREYRAPDQKFVQCFCSSTRCSGVIGVPMDKKAITKLLLQDIHYQDDDLNILCGENRVLEAQNKQLRKQIAMIKPMFNNLLDEVFIPITDHRPEDVRLNNSRVVREFLNDQEVTLSVRDAAAAAAAVGPLLDNDVTTPSGSSRSTTDPRPTVAAISGTGRRSSTRSSKRSAEPDRTVADDGGVGEEGDEGHRVEVTPPSKKRRTSPRLSVQKIPGCMIESTISGEADEKGTTSCDEAKSPSGSRRASTQPPPIPVVAVRVEDAVDEFYRINVGLLEEDDDDIIDVTPEATRALPAPGPSSGTSAVSRKPIVELKRHKSLYTDQIIDWYKAMTLVRAAEGSAGDILPCPIHKKDKLRKMREVRKHFFLSHAGAANTYKEQLEKRGKSLSDSETTLFQDSQKIRNGT